MGAWFIVRLKGLLSLALMLSVTVTVKLLVPLLVGVPANIPVDERLNPVGSAPLVTA